MKTPVLSSRRLTLDSVTAADVDAIHEYCQDADIHRFTRVPAPYGRADAEQFVAGHVDAETLWALRENGSLIGTAELRSMSPGVSECGYWMGAPFRGRGLMTEALGAMIEYAFDPAGLALERVTWEAATGNIASAAVVHRNGFTFDGTAPLGLELHGQHFDAWRGSLHLSDSRQPKNGWPL